MTANGTGGSWMKQTMNDETLAWARPRSVRRRLVVAHVGISALMAGLMAWGAATDNAWALAGMVVLLVVAILVIGTLNASVRGVTELGERDLDEWQNRTRDATYRRLFMPAVSALGAVAAVILFVDAPLFLEAAVFLFSWFIVTGLPVLVLAWSLDDEPADA